MSNLLENTQRKAALAITNAYRHTPNKGLLIELGLDSLKQRRQKAKLILFYKIKNNLAPNYLKTLLPPTMTAHYNIRNAEDIRPPKAKTNYFLKSFIPSTIRLWNKLITETRHLKNISDYNTALNLVYTKNLIYKPYIQGDTRGHIHVSRMRMGLSGLNSHRKRFHFIQNSNCPVCNARNEDNTHYMLVCPTYAAQRMEMTVQLNLLLPHLDTITLFNNIGHKRTRDDLTKTLVYGTEVERDDIVIFGIVANFIQETQRFL